MSIEAIISNAHMVFLIGLTGFNLGLTITIYLEMTRLKRERSQLQQALAEAGSLRTIAMRAISKAGPYGS